VAGYILNIPRIHLSFLYEFALDANIQDKQHQLLQQADYGAPFTLSIGQTLFEITVECI
jgi:hypothetical protein